MTELERARISTGERTQSDANLLSVEEALEQLSHEIRLEIVRVLAAAEGSSDEPPLSFSALYARLDVDDSGQFNYHLSRLVPHFVAQHREGYRLTRAGRRAARAIGCLSDPNTC